MPSSHTLCRRVLSDCTSFRQKDSDCLPPLDETASAKDQSSMHSVQALPAEIQDEIVDHLSEDSQALRTCALTCRRWARRAQMHLFRKCIILNHDDLLHMQALLELDPRLGQFVREIIINPRHASPPQPDHIWTKLLTKMDRAESLDIGNINIFANPSVRGDLQTNFSHLRVLRLLGAQNLHREDFLSLLVACPFLSELHVSDMVSIEPDLFAVPIDSLGIPPAAEPVLRLLSIGAASNIGMSCLLFYFASQTSLRKLQLIVGDSVSGPECADLLRLAAPVIEELTLRLHTHLPLLPILQSTPPFQRLRLLHLKHAGLERYVGNHDDAHWIVTALGHISRWEQCLILREIVLTMPMPRDRERSRREPIHSPLGTGFPFPWVQLDMAMAKLAQENEMLVFKVNVCGAGQKKERVSLTDPRLGRYRLRMSRTEELRPQVLTVLIGPRWLGVGGEFGGQLL